MAQLHPVDNPSRYFSAPSPRRGDSVCHSSEKKKTERGIVKKKPWGFHISTPRMCQRQAWEAAALGPLSGKPVQAKYEVAVSHHHWVKSPRTRITGKWWHSETKLWLVRPGISLEEENKGPPIWLCDWQGEKSVFQLSMDSCVPGRARLSPSSFLSTFLRCFQSFPSEHFPNILPENCPSSLKTCFLFSRCCHQRAVKTRSTQYAWGACLLAFLDVFRITGFSAR